MSAEPKKVENKIAKRVGYVLGTPVLLGILGIWYVFYLSLNPPDGSGAGTAANNGKIWTTTGDIIARAHTYGPIRISQNQWIICPTINPAHQNMSIHIVEDDVWVDYIIDGVFYRDTPRCLPGHRDIKICEGSAYRVRVTPGTAVKAATIMITVSEY